VLRCVERQRRLVPEPLVGALAGPQALPLRLRLPAGSYVVEVGAPGRETVPVPALIERAGRWDAVPPEGGPAVPVRLPAPEEAPHAPEDPAPAFVAAGWAWVGARRREKRIYLAAQRVWIDDLWVDRYPVTNAQFIRFLDDLVAQGDEAAALRWAPRYRGGGSIYGRRADGGFCLVPDADGDQWGPDWPVFEVTWAAACAYAAWRAARTGHPWRLPTELEWRKAVGGVDGRSYPWGEAEVDAYANTRFGRPGRMLPAPVGAHPEDRSPYGVLGGAGGVMDWCLDAWRDEGPPVDPRGRPLAVAPDPEAQHPVCGGSWTWPVAACTLNARNVAPPTTTREWWGIRLCCEATHPPAGRLPA
jgi:serine/threonine-protein kinase